MDDRDGPIVADWVYDELLRDYPHVNLERVPFALDTAVRKLRDTGVHFSRWATYVHIGV
jgi:uncharacterized protein (DUF433 family)